MVKRDIIVVGASAGGVAALLGLLQGLPKDLAASVLVVLHIPPDTKSHLAEILARSCALEVREARDHEQIASSTVYVAQADRHLLLGEDTIRITRGPKECRARPAVDALFRSAAVAYGPRVIGIVMTGMLDDGTAGLWAVKDQGGIALVQDPATAEFPSMPESAMKHVQIDAALAIPELAARIVALVGERTSRRPGPAPNGIRSKPSSRARETASKQVS
jgi:two-component system chemotaxis response regulator CheB